MFYNFVNYGSTNEHVVEQIYLNNKVCGNGFEIVELFPKHFQSVYTKYELQNKIFLNINQSQESSGFQLTRLDLEKQLTLKISFFSGSDLICPILIKKCDYELSYLRT